jgi:CHAT domain-containing protein
MAFMSAGASSVVASYWPVRDEEAAASLIAIHRKMTAGVSITTALAAVQREAITNNSRQWLPWMVLGGSARIPQG